MEQEPREATFSGRQQRPRPVWVGQQLGFGQGLVAAPPEARAVADARDSRAVGLLDIFFFDLLDILRSVRKNKWNRVIKTFEFLKPLKGWKY